MRAVVKRKNTEITLNWQPRTNFAIVLLQLIMELGIHLFKNREKVSLIYKNYKKTNVLKEEESLRSRIWKKVFIIRMDTEAETRGISRDVLSPGT